MITNTKPQQLDAENAVISCIMETPELFYDMEPKLKPEMFYGLDNAVIFSIIIKLVLANKIPDVVLLKQQLQESGQFDAIGGDDYLALITNIQVTQSNFGDYVQLVHDAYIQREIIAAGNKIVDAGYEQPANTALDVLYEESNKVIFNNASGVGVETISDILEQELQALKIRLLNPGGDGLKTQLVEYDLITGGLYPTDEIILAARPSVGKTALACRIMLNMAKQGIPVAMFSFEMSNQQLSQRLLSMESSVPLSHLKSGRLSERDYNGVVRAAKTIETLPIYIKNSASGGISHVLS